MGFFDLFKKKNTNSKDLSVPIQEKKYYQADSYYTDTAFKDTAFERNVITFEERKKTAFPSKNGLYPAEILLLEYCTYGTYPSPKNGYPGFWWFEYSIRDVGAALKALESRGFIEYSSVSESLISLTLTQLKELLVTKKQSVSGKKVELISRVTNCYSEEELLSKGFEPKYKLTEKGKTELEENAYVPYMHKSPAKTIEDSKFGKSFNVWSINKTLGIGDKSNWKSVVEECEISIAKETKDRNTAFMEKLKKTDFEGYQKLSNQDEQLLGIKNANKKYIDTNDLSEYIAFWENIWANGGLLFNGSRWWFELADLYIEAKRFDDAEAFVKKIKKINSTYSDKADYYLNKIKKQKK